MGIPLASMIVSVMLFSEQYKTLNWQFIRICIPISIGYTTVFWLVLRWCYYQMRKRYPAVQDLRKRVLGFTVIWLVAYGVLHLFLDKAFKLLFPQHEGEPSLLLDFLATFLLTALVITLYEAIAFYSELQRTLAEKSELERRQVQSQLEGLRSQVNPHFLFNSLNTLIYLISENSDQAVRFVQKLSKVYRYVLENKDAITIPLQEELDYLNAYVFLLKERFGDNLRVQLGDLSQCPQAPMVPQTLQMLFENAIKHNVISAEHPLTIEVFCENGHLIVRNNLQKKNQVLDSTGIGLENIRARYRLAMQREVQVIVSSGYFTVIVPLS